jgi:hypothetical protein
MGTPSLPGAVVNNQSIGSINFGGYNGNAWTNSLLNGGGYNPGAILMYASETWSGDATTSIYAGTGWFVRAQANGIQLNATSRQRYLHGFSTAGNRTDPPQHFLRIGTADNTAPTLINSNGIDTHVGHGRTSVEYINTLPVILGVTAFDYTTFTANFTGTTMTVTGISSGILSVGQRVYGDPTGLSSGTFIVSQTSGTTGSTGVYVISIAHPTGANSVVTTGGPDNETLWNSNSLIISGARKSGVSGRRNQLQVNDSLGAIYFYGQRANNSTGYGNLGGGIAFTALEKFTASANGTQAQIFTKNSGTLVSGVRLQLDNISNHYHSDNHVFFNSNNTEMVSMSTASVNVTAHMIPNADLAYDLGSTSSQWRSLYVGTGTIYIGGVALGVNADNYVTVDGNPIITVNTAGNLTIQGDVNIGTVIVSSTAPTATTGTQWFNTVEGRTYVATGGVWLDASPTQIPSPETYLDNIEIDGSILYINSSTLTINTSGTLLVNGNEVTGSGGGSGWQLTSSTAVVSLSSTGTLTLPGGGTISEVTVTPGGGGNPSVGILLTPFVSDEFGTPNPDMAVKIYPTFNDDDHIHIVAGNPTTVDLFLGDDDQYVKLEQNHGNIVVGTNTTVSNSTWTFGTDGVLTLSTASTILGNSEDPNVYIETVSTSTAINTWTFDADGSLTFPDATVQTTAYVAANVVNKTSGSWTLATGSNTVSITVPTNGNYTMWVNGNIPNGIVNWNATVNVSNTNVPAIGSQYAWYYATGNALVLTAIPDQIVGTMGVISSSTDYLGITADVFTFGITNNSTSTQVINWGYTTL